jgi:serine/threonine-protein kinase RsbW
MRPETFMDELQERLQLDSRLSDLSRVSPWLEALANRFDMEEKTRFALHLCMEEALANVVLHGYRNEPGHPILVGSSFTAGTLRLTIEDHAPPFAPPAELPSVATNHTSLESIEPGGNGIRLMRHFAGSLVYERTANGNRLIIGFPIGPK